MPATPEAIADGIVQIVRGKDGWIFVQIGRGRYVKRFNLRDTEARQLLELLSELLG